MPLGGISLNRRAIGLVLAVVLAMVATVAIVSYVQGIRQEAEEGQEPVDVFVAKENILVGSPADQAISTGFIARETRPRSTIAEGVILTLEEIRGKFAKQDIFKGQEILGAMFVESAADIAQLGGGLEIPDNRMAISVEVPLVPAVAGFIQQGDRISILSQVAVGERQTRVRFLLQDIEVLAMGARGSVPPPVPGAPIAAPPPTGLVTVAVTASQAEQLTFATFNGKLYFTLLPPGARPVRTRGRTAGNLYGR